MKGSIKFNLFNFHLNSYSENLIASKEFTIIEDLVIDSESSDIFIEPCSDEIIKVELYSEDSDEYYIKEEDNKIKISLKAKKNKKHFFNKTNRIIVKLPSQYDKNASIHFTTADLKIDSFANLKIDVNGTTGDIKATEIDTLEFELSTGDIKVDNLKYISGKLTTGDIKIDKIYKRVSAKTTTGDIKIGKAIIEEDSTITTETGDVKIDSLEGAYIEANTNTGDIRVNNNDRKLEKTVTIKTTTGDIKVN